MTDFEQVESDSGPQGGLASAMGAFAGLNDGLTRFHDGIFGPDSTDTFDASCNTCKHFLRKAMTAEEKAERNIFGMPGHCAKKDRPTIAWHRGQFCGYENAECYENRRTGLTPAQGAANNKARLDGLQPPYPTANG